MSLIISLAENTAEQNIPAGVIEKLYNLTFTTVGGVETLRQDAPTTLIGTVSLAGPTYQEYVTSLTTLYSQFHVNANGYYVLFEDPIVKQLCATTWGDGTGVTTAQLSSVSNNNTIKNLFAGNTNITKFNEFRYFTSVTNMSDTFSNCTNLTEITFPSTGSILLNGYVLGGCTNLLVVNLTNVTNIHGNNFDDDSSLTELYFPNVTAMSSRNWTTTDFGEGFFRNLSSLKKVKFDKIVYFYKSDNGWSNPWDFVFCYCSLMRILDLGSSITTYGGYIFGVGKGTFPNMQAIIFRTNTPPSVPTIPSNTDFTWGNSTCNVYVPLAAYSTYLATAPFDTLYQAGRLKTIENDYDEATIMAN